MSGTRRLAAIMFVDMVGYTASSQADESGTIRRLLDLENLLQPIIAESGGHKIKSTGDGMLIEFESALKACLCAVEIQQRLHEKPTQASTQGARLRIGIHLGDVVEHGSDILGDAVNIAARIEPLAEPGGVCISGEVYAQVRGKSPTLWEELPPRELKGIQHPVSLYRAVLRWNGAQNSHATTDRSRLAVLPFANFSPDAHDEYFADGLTEELITVLAKIDGLRVIARTSVFPYKSTNKSMSLIGAELGVSTILEGSVRKAGDRVRVTAQLIDVTTQAHRWAETYDRKLEDIFAVQTEVATEVAKALEMRLTKSHASRTPERGPTASESYLEYLRGRAAIAYSFSEASVKEALWRFERALALDPSNARACAALSRTTHLMGVWHRLGAREQSDVAARELSLRAIRLDPNLADGHGALGLILYDNMEWEAAEKEAHTALALNPSLSDTRSWYSMLLQEEGRGEEAHREMSLAFESDPQSRMLAGMLTNLRIFLRRLDEAGSSLDRLRDLDSGGRYYHLSAASYYLARGDAEKARSEASLADSIPAEDGYTGPTVVRAMVLIKTGQPEEGRELLREFQSHPQFSMIGAEAIAVAYGMLGDLDASFGLLEKKLSQEGNLGVQQLRLDPFAEPIRRDPRFGDLLRRLRLAE